MPEDKKALFGEEDRVKITLTKEAGQLTFQRAIGASTLEAACNGLTVLVAHLAELSGVSVGVLMGYMARMLLEGAGEGEAKSGE